MREILFRGKQKDADVWLVGELRQWSEHKKGICNRALKTTLEVDPETIGQFTGLTDKNEKKIFEGDIINCYSPFGINDFRCGVVHWSEMFCSWRVVGHSLYGDGLSIYEIIGNIYDNIGHFEEVTEDEN